MVHRGLGPVASARPGRLITITRLSPASLRTWCLATVADGVLSCFDIAQTASATYGAVVTQTPVSGARSPITPLLRAHRRGWRAWRMWLLRLGACSERRYTRTASHQRSEKPAKRHHFVRERSRRRAPLSCGAAVSKVFFLGPSRSGQCANPRDSDRLQTSGVWTLPPR